jgi:hypothetical protein
MISEVQEFISPFVYDRNKSEIMYGNNYTISKINVKNMIHKKLIFLALLQKTLLSCSWYMCVFSTACRECFKNAHPYSV